MSKKMIFEMMDAISLASYTDEVKVIIIAASGDVYSAGHDLKQITEARTDKDNSSDYFRDLFESCSSLMKLIVEFERCVYFEDELRLLQ